MLLPSIERFGVKHNVGTVARLGAGDVALAAQLHPRHRQNRPGRGDSQGQSGSAGDIEMRLHRSAERRDQPAVAVGEGEDVMLVVFQT